MAGAWTALWVTWAGLGWRYFERVPNGWDQAEYAWAVRDGYLPHSPYVLYYGLGRASSWLFGDAGVALSAISAASAALSIVLVAAVSSRLGASRLVSGLAAAGLASNYLFVRFAGTQEVYAPQLGVGLLAAWLLASGRPVLGGVAVGAAVTMHTGSVFLLPALFVARPGGRAAGPWMTIKPAVIAALVTAMTFGATLLAMPRLDGGLDKAYLRGIAPGLRWDRLSSGGLWDSAVGLVSRLAAPDISEVRLPAAHFPVGLGALHLCLAVIGVVVASRRLPSFARFWACWVLPFLVYEVCLGASLDAGIYVVFVLPAVVAMVGYSVEAVSQEIVARGGRRALSLVVATLILGVLSVPSVVLLTTHRGDVEAFQASPRNPERVYDGLDGELPNGSVVIQPRGEWNGNALAYFGGVRPVFRHASQLSLFVPRGPLTPLNGSAFVPLTTPLLAGLLRDGTPVFAFEHDPLSGAPGVDPAEFMWEPVAVAGTGAPAGLFRGKPASVSPPASRGP